MKKFATLTLVLIMLLSTMTMMLASAAGNGSITVTNPEKDAAYTAYKIFDVIYDNAKENFDYKIAGNSEWLSVVQSYSGLTLTKNAVNYYNVSENENFSAADFAKHLSANLQGKTGIALTNNGTTATVSGLDLGYYLVDTTAGALCSLTTTTPTAEIQEKNHINFDKIDDKESVEIGEIVTYTVNAEVPNTTGYNKYKYLVTDTMSEGLTFNPSTFSITLNGESMDRRLYTFSPNAKGFTLNIDMLKLDPDRTKVGQPIVMTYKAKVNEKAVARIERNNIVLEYSNDPGDDTKTGTIEDSETVYSAKVVVDKYVEGATAEKLAGAQFVLYKTENGQKKYYKFVNNEVTWVSRNDADRKTTNDKGAVQFNGLKDGTYNLEETVAPKGYNRLTSDPTVIINGADATTVNVSSLTVTVGVGNSSGTELPETGGMGTTLLYIIGAALVAGAFIVFVIRRRVATK